MNTPLLKPILLGAFALGASVLTPSCVEPGYGYGAPHHDGYRSGYVVRELPRGYHEEMIGGVRYYNHGGSYYRRQGSSYIVVDSPHRRGPSPVIYNKPSPSHNYGSSQYNHHDSDRHDGNGDHHSSNNYNSKNDPKKKYDKKPYDGKPGDHHDHDHN